VNGAISFSHHISRQLAKYGRDRAYVFLCGDPEDDMLAKTWTYAELDRRARRLAASMARRNLPKHPLLLLYPPGLEFLEALIGCLYYGVVAVPAPLPTESSTALRLRGILEDAGIEFVLTAALSDSLRDQLREICGPMGITVIETDVQPFETGEYCTIPNIDSSSVAILQYTSGSTGEPKGVMVTQGNLLYNEQRIRDTIGSNDTDVVVGWLPHFHDMGLIGLLLHPLYVGANCIFFSPMMFMIHPVRWLQAMSLYRATITVAPNFAYDLCTRIVSDNAAAKLDLSSLRVALNGAEPIRYRTLERFAARFKETGFRAETFSPCYGMAEATLLASGSSSGSAPVFCDVDATSFERGHVRLSVDGGAIRLVSSGRFVSEELRIVDPVECNVQPDCQIGEVWLRGPSVATGYWNKPSISDATFKATTVDGQGPYLRSGDLGFTMDGELYLTGRIKDVIIINGRNLHPQDIEIAIRDLHASLESCSAAVFSVASDREHVVVVQEVKRALLRDISIGELVARIKNVLLRSFGIAAPTVVITKRGVVQRTTSGKIRRQLMRSLFLNGEIEPLEANVRRATSLSSEPAAQLRQRIQ